MGGRYPNIIRDNGQRKRGILDCEVEAIKEYLLGMYAEGWTEREAGNKKTRTRKAYPSFCV